MTKAERDGWVLLAGEPQQAIRAAAVESVKARREGGTTLRMVSGETFRLQADIDDVMDAVSGKYDVPLALTERKAAIIY